MLTGQTNFNSDRSKYIKNSRVRTRISLAWTDSCKNSYLQKIWVFFKINSSFLILKAKKSLYRQWGSGIFYECGILLYKHQWDLARFLVTGLYFIENVVLCRNSPIKTKMSTLNAKNTFYYSTIMSFYHIRSRERGKHEAIIHCSVVV